MTDINTKPPISIFELYETDADAEENGKWFDEFGGKIKFKIRRYSSAASRKAREVIHRPLLRTYKTFDKIPEDLGDTATVKHLAEAIVVGWEGIYDRQGNEMAYSKEAALDLFTKLPDLAKQLVLLSINMDSFKKDSTEEVKGNF